MTRTTINFKLLEKHIGIIKIDLKLEGFEVKEGGDIINTILVSPRLITEDPINELVWDMMVASGKANEIIAKLIQNLNEHCIGHNDPFNLQSIISLEDYYNYKTFYFEVEELRDKLLS